MTSPDNSLLVQLTACVLGPPTGNPTLDAMDQAILAVYRIIAEMNSTGFDTNSLFEQEYLAARQEAQAPFLITSLATNTEYIVVPQARIKDTFLVAVQVHTPGRVPKSFYKMTLVRAPNGSIRANRGW